MSHADDEFTYEEVLQTITELAEELGWRWVIVKNEDGEVVGVRMGNDNYIKIDSKEVTRIH